MSPQGRLQPPALWRRLVPLIGQMNPDASTIAAGAPVEIDLKPIAEGQIVKVFWRSKPIFIFHRAPKDIELAEDVDWHSLPDPEPELGAGQEGARAVAGGDRHLHPSRLHSARASGQLRRLVLSVPWLAIRQRGPHPAGAGAEEPLPPPYQFVSNDKIRIG